ncbi:hypothetical protein OG365_24435 [Streptomyces sp. NBC_00853]|uniref:hypothetical protein n=1 Tax=Streptomyces sp. NBC_00853 TaxID=2903681 RepID=UPI0038736295|nr:hypothetical protein OG365_24435 [Streptomyces sp. NBC_00853]
MPSYRYSEYSIETRDGTRKTIAIPVVEITVTTSSGRSLTMKALVDSAAPFCLFTRRAANDLGLAFSPASQQSVNVLCSGGQHIAFRFPIRLHIDGWSSHAWNTNGWFFYNPWDLSPPLLGAICGNEGFIEQWHISLNRARRYFTIEPP